MTHCNGDQGTTRRRSWCCDCHCFVKFWWYRHRWNESLCNDSSSMSSIQVVTHMYWCIIWRSWSAFYRATWCPFLSEVTCHVHWSSHPINVYIMCIINHFISCKYAFIYVCITICHLFLEILLFTLKISRDVEVVSNVNFCVIFFMLNFPVWSRK
jgi:hypothetical protein